MPDVAPHCARRPGNQTNRAGNAAAAGGSRDKWRPWLLPGMYDKNTITSENDTAKAAMIVWIRERWFRTQFDFDIDWIRGMILVSNLHRSLLDKHGASMPSVAFMGLFRNQDPKSNFRIVHAPRVHRSSTGFSPSMGTNCLPAIAADCAQGVVEERDNPCTHCRVNLVNQKTVFTNCRRLKDNAGNWLFGGACTNCAYSNSQAHCSLARQAPNTDHSSTTAQAGCHERGGPSARNGPQGACATNAHAGGLIAPTPRQLRMSLSDLLGDLDRTHDLIPPSDRTHPDWMVRFNAPHAGDRRGRLVIDFHYESRQGREAMRKHVAGMLRDLGKDGVFEFEYGRAQRKFKGE